MNLEIKNLNISNYNINLNIYTNEKVGIYCREKNIVTSFLELISGINNNKNTVFANDINVFNNKDYLLNRVFFDFKRKYLTTLRVNKIEEALKEYNIDFDKDKFVSICKELNVRGETDITYKYDFTPVGNTFVNLALILSMNKENIIINNPLTNLNLKSDQDYFVGKLTNSEFTSVVLGLDKIDCFKGKLNRIIFFTDYNEVVSVHNNDTLIVFNKDIDKYYLIKNKLFKGENLIALNTYSKEDLKLWQKQKVKFEIISIYEIEKYIGEVWKKIK